MSAPPDLAETIGGAMRSGFRWELDRALRANAYLRVFFSSALLFYCAFGPGLLIRFPIVLSEPYIAPLSQFYAFRPAIFALGLAALSCVLAALARRGQELFEVALAEDGPSDPGRYIRNLRPSPLPFVLSGNLTVDFIVFCIALAAYVFWVILLVETTPLVLQVYQGVGVVLGSYGFFASVIVIAFVWAGLARRIRGIMAGRKVAGVPEKPSPV